MPSWISSWTESVGMNSRLGQSGRGSFDADRGVPQPSKSASRVAGAGVWIRVSAVFLFAMILGSSLTGCSKKTVQDSGAAADPVAAPLEVPVVPITERLIERTTEVVGSLTPDAQVTLSNQVEGLVLEVKVDLGSRVRRGDVVVEIDPREFRLQLLQARAALAQAKARLGLTSEETIDDPEKTTIVQQARAALAEAQSKFDSGHKLHMSGDIPEQRFVELDNNLKSRRALYQAAWEEVRQQMALIEARKAEVGLAEKRLSDTTIRAPFDGGVSAKLVERGQLVKANSPLVTIVKDDVLRLRPVIPEAAISTLKIGAPVRFSVDAYTGRSFTAKISRLSPAVDEQARTLVAEAFVPNSSGELRPGMFARIQLGAAQRSSALMLPSSAILNFAGLSKVFVVEGDHVVERQAKLGARDGDWVEIVEGVQRGDRVANARLDRLENNGRIKIIP